MTDFNLEAAATLLTDLRQIAASDLRDLAGIIDPADQPDSPGPDLLARMIPHVAYELVAMQQARLAWEVERSWIARERALLHARILSDFFWPQHKNGSTGVIRAEHYAPAWRTAGGARPDVIRDRSHAVDQQLAHFTRDRIADVPRDEIPVSAIVDAVWDAWHPFLAGLEGPEHASMFRWFLAERASQWQIPLPPDVT